MSNGPHVRGCKQEGSLVVNNNEINHYSVKRSLQIQPVQLNSYKLLSSRSAELIYLEHSLSVGPRVFH